MKAKKEKKLKAKLKRLKKACQTARRHRKTQEKNLAKALRKEEKARAAFEKVMLQLQPASEKHPASSASDNVDPLATDNLREIPGLGPKFEQLLHQAGITTFTQLHQLPADQWVTILAQAGSRYRNFDPGPWQAEAARLMNESVG